MLAKAQAFFRGAEIPFERDGEVRGAEEGAGGRTWGRAKRKRNPRCVEGFFLCLRSQHLSQNKADVLKKRGQAERAQERGRGGSRGREKEKERKRRGG